MHDEIECHTLWRIQKTIFQLCHDRDYEVSQEELDRTLEEFKGLYGDKPSLKHPARNELSVYVAHNDDITDTLFVFLSDEPVIGIRTVKDFCEIMEEESNVRAIIVAQHGLAESAKQMLDDMGDNYIFEFFLEEELMINITEEEKVHEHVPLPLELATEMLAQKNLTLNDITRIRVGDPVARYYGLRKGEVAKVTKVEKSRGVVKREISFKLVV